MQEHYEYLVEIQFVNHFPIQYRFDYLEDFLSFVNTNKTQLSFILLFIKFEQVFVSVCNNCYNIKYPFLYYNYSNSIYIYDLNIYFSSNTHTIQ